MFDLEKQSWIFPKNWNTAQRDKDDADLEEVAKEKAWAIYALDEAGNV